MQMTNMAIVLIIKICNKNKLFSYGLSSNVISITEII